MRDNQFAIELVGAASLITGKAWKFAASWRYRERRTEAIMIRSMSRRWKTAAYAKASIFAKATT